MEFDVVIYSQYTFLSTELKTFWDVTVNLSGIYLWLFLWSRTSTEDVPGTR